MRKRTPLIVGAVFAAAVTAAVAQDAPSAPAPTTVPQPAPGTELPAATVPGTQAPAVPAPTRIPATTVPAYPPYAGTTARPQTLPAPVAAPPPAVAAPAAVQTTAQMQGMPPYGVPDEDRPKLHYGSVYIPVDSWVYPELSRLYSMGFLNTMFLGLRPYTQQAVLHMLDASEDDIMTSNNEEAQEIFTAIKREIRYEDTGGLDTRGTIFGTKAVYDRVMGISGQTLNDSYHIGQTVVNDYGRPTWPGFNNLVGLREIGEWGRFSLDVRGEYQHSPGNAGYSYATAQELSQGAPGYEGNGIAFTGPGLHQATLPYGPIPSTDRFHLIEAYLSVHVLGHDISGGKSDAWLGPGQGGAMAWSNNADNIYSFRINRQEPLRIPLLSLLTGPFRYDFFYGDLKGHTTPEDDWVHSEIVSFRPTKDLEFAFQRTIIFGGKGHEPVTLHTFLKGFFDPNDSTSAEKFSRDDPGARFGDFTASWRLPYLEKFATLYVDSESHDDVTPISAPRRASYRTGLYLSQFPGLRKLDFRVEAATTDPGVSRSYDGQFAYYEAVQQQAYTNSGFIMGDWIGREGKGGNASFTYHLSGNEWVQVHYLTKKDEKDFIPGLFNYATYTYGPGGTTQNQFKVDVLKRFDHDNVELYAWFQHETWKAPIYLPGAQTNNIATVQLTFFPKLKRSLGNRIGSDH